MWFLFDNPTSKVDLRSEISSEYKANRRNKDTRFFKSVEVFKNILLSSKENYKVGYMDFVEADDVVYLVLKFLVDDDALMISTDLDWSRCIGFDGKRVHWYNYKDIYTIREFEEKYGFAPSTEKVALYKAITGDASDNISPGVLNIRKEHVVRICKEFSTLNELMVNLIDITYLSEKMKSKISNSENKLRLNWQLVNFMNLDMGKNQLLEHIYDCKFRQNTLRTLLKSIDFVDFDDRLNTKQIGSIFKQKKVPRK
jgi:5'-3' exonuclease